MLHSESGKDRAEGYCQVVLTVISFVLISGCTGQLTETETERIARLRVQLLNDSAQDARRHLGLLLSQTDDSLAADVAVDNYYRHDGEWLWVSDDATMLLYEADTLAGYLRQQARGMGFGDDAFFSEELKGGIDHFRQFDFDSTGVGIASTMAAIELGLSKGVMRYAMGQRYGFTRPEAILNPKGGRRVYDIADERPADDFLEQVFGHQGDMLHYLSTLEPTDTIYQHLKRLLAADTLSAESRHRIISNMERRRWHHKKQPAEGQPYVFVNIPSQQLWAIRPDSVFSMRICCGKWDTKTPLLISAINRVELNPEWKIPFNIVRDEVSRHAGDSAYFARHNYYITKGGTEVSAKSVTPEQMSAGGYRVTQRSGAGNSLGRIIFRFPNQFDVFLHDTNSRGAFNAERRTISHGCVRVQRPFDLARFVLPDASERLLDEMRISIDMKPEAEWGKEYMKKREEVKDSLADQLDKKYPTRLRSSVGVDHVPVIIDYYTLYPNPETGRWETWRDRYEYDKTIIDSLKPFLP